MSTINSNGIDFKDLSEQLVRQVDKQYEERSKISNGGRYTLEKDYDCFRILTVFGDKYMTQQEAVEQFENALANGDNKKTQYYLNLKNPSNERLISPVIARDMLKKTIAVFKSTKRTDVFNYENMSALIRMKEQGKTSAVFQNHARRIEQLLIAESIAVEDIGAENAGIVLKAAATITITDPNHPNHIASELLFNRVADCFARNGHADIEDNDLQMAYTAAGEADASENIPALKNYKKGEHTLDGPIGSLQTVPLN